LKPHLLFLIWKNEGQKRAIRDKLRDSVAPKIIELANPGNLTVYCDDPENDAPSQAMNIAPLAPPVTGMFVFGPVSRDDDEVENLKDNVCSLLKDEGFSRIEAYLVDQSVYTEYGEYAGPCVKGFWPKETAKTWPDGSRTPYPVALTMFPIQESRKTDKVAWEKDWFGIQGPMSEMIQPRIRYVRNVVRKRLTPTAPEYAGLVIESWPSNKHMSNPFLFFFAKNPWQLALHVTVMLRSVTNIMPFTKICQQTVGEYIIRQE